MRFPISGGRIDTATVVELTRFDIVVDATPPAHRPGGELTAFSQGLLLGVATVRAEL